MKRAGKELAALLLKEAWSLQTARTLYVLREQTGLSREDVAKRAEVPVSTVSRLEEADLRWVSLPQLVHIKR